jgi:hypothetical protein
MTMSHFYVASLDQMLIRFATIEASKQRVFVAERLTDTERELRRAEETLRQLHEINKVIALQERANRVVETPNSLGYA